MKANSASVEKSEEDVCDTISEDELPGEQNQWCPLLEHCFRYTVGRKLVKAIRVVSARYVSGKCMFAIFSARGSQVSRQVFVVVRTFFFFFKKKRKPQSRRHFV